MTDLFSSNAEVDAGNLFQEPQKEVQSVETPASDINLAMQGAIIDGTDVSGMYTQLSGMSSDERKAALEGLTRDIKEKQVSDSVNIVASIIQDPTMTEDQKQRYVDTLSGIEASPVDSLNLMAESLYVAEPEEESEEEATRFQELGEVLDQVMELQRAKQKAINTLAFDDETGEAVSIVNNLGDTAELFLSFTEQTFAAHFRSKLDSGEVSTPRQIFEFFMLGEGKQSFKEGYASAPIEDRLALVEQLPELLKSSKSIMFMNDQALLQLDMLMTGINSEYYGDFERTVDNLVGVFDAVGLGWLLKPLVKIPKAARLARIKEFAKQSVKRVRTKKQPAAPMSVAEKVAPAQAREMARVVDEDLTGEAAQALTGTDRADALADVYSPQVRSADGSVEAKPVALDRSIRQAAFEESGKLFLKTSELEATRQKLLTDITSVGNLVSRPELSIAPILRNNGTYDIGQTYTLASGGFTSPTAAIKEVLESLEYYGVKEGDLTLKRWKGGEYVPTTLKEVEGSAALREGFVKSKKKLPEELKKVNNLDDYAVEVNFNYSPRAVDIVRDENVTVNLNWMDRFSNTAPVPGKSTASRQLFPASFMLDQDVYSGSVLAVDQGNRLHKVLMDDARELLFDRVAELPADRQHVLNRVISEQNLARKNYSTTELASMGVTDPKEIAVLDGYKKVSDTNWHLTNMDMAKTLRDTGHSFYVDKSTQDKFIGKVVNPNTPVNNRPAKVYDPVAKTYDLPSAQWDEVAESGGHVMELRVPQLIEDLEAGTVREVSHILLRKSDDTRYIKSIQTDDTILPYIPGHSHVRYLDGWFIDRQLVDANGAPVGVPQAVITAKNTKSAEKARETFEKNASVADKKKGTTWKYTARPEAGLDPVDITLRHFDVASNAGLSSQRRRGQTLKSFDSTKVEDLNPHIADPLDSLNQSIAELAKRIPLREYLDDLEQRILNDYASVLPKHELTKKPRLPISGEKLGSGVTTGSEGKLIADLRTNLEHYNFMKFGYHNSLDHHWRSKLNYLGQYAGKASSRLEKVIKAIPEEIPSPVGWLRGLAFNMNIAASAPASQWFVQGIPAGLNALLHPDYVFKSGGLARDWRRLSLGILADGKESALRKIMSKEEVAEVVALKKEWDRTGFAAGIDKHLLVEGGIEQMIETTRFSKVKKANEAVFGTLRELGFDKGETFNLGTFWLSTRNDAIKSGKDMGNVRDFAEVNAKTRQLTMNMNRAGEMPWNKNALSLWTQFMVSPYKSFTMILDRGLTAEERVKVGMWQGLMMPLPIALTYEIRARVNLEGEEGEAAAEVITNGLLGGTFNTAINAMLPETGSASWQRAVQSDYHTSGAYKLIDALLSDTGGTSVITALAQTSPSLSAFEGYNPVATNLMKSLGGLMASPFSEDQNEEAVTAMEAFAGPNGALWQYTALGRGLSTAWKELFLEKYGKRRSALNGNEVDPSVTTAETMAKLLLGLESTTQTVARAAKTSTYIGSQDERNDLDHLFKVLSRAATDKGFNPEDPKRIEYVMRAAHEVYDGQMSPEAAKYFSSKLSKDKSLLNHLMNSAKLDPESAARAAAAMRFLDPEMREAYEYFNSEQALMDMREGE